jgi:septal ring factor EnvC (AmiA/AmiB activator)
VTRSSFATAVLVALVGVGDAAANGSHDDGADEFRAFIAETREKVQATHLDELEQRQRRIDRALVVRGQAYVKTLRSGLLPLSEGFDDMLSHLSRTERLRHALQGDVAAGRELERRRHELASGIAALRERRAQLARDAMEYERSREAILAARDREASFRRAFGEEVRSEHAAIYAAPADRVAHENFAAAKGKLPLPVPGRAEVRAVRLPDALGPGVFIAVEAGSIITTVHRGRVVLTGSYGELGRSVVIDHADGYSTLSAQLGVVTVEAGDTVKAGDSIGTLAESARGNLYFEVRFSGVALEPAEWFGL